VVGYLAAEAYTAHHYRHDSVLHELVRAILEPDCLGGWYLARVGAQVQAEDFGWNLNGWTRFGLAVSLTEKVWNSAVVPLRK
jgi:hypothetical protein